MMCPIFLQKENRRTDRCGGICVFVDLPLSRYAVNVVPIFARGSGLGFAVIVAGCVGELVVGRTNADLCPIVCCTVIVYSLQATARTERKFTNARDAIGNHDARQAAAIIERIIANARDAIGNRNARQATARTERKFTNARDAVAYRHARKTCATVERIFTNDFVFYRHTRKTCATVERIRAYARDAIEKCHAF